MTEKDQILAEAVDAACEAVFIKMWPAHANRTGGWAKAADGLPGTSAAEWREEELEALLPALAVLERAGVLTWPEET